jgi:hypothetical protein
MCKKNFFFFLTSQTKYKIVTNQPDRSKCLFNYNELTNFTKSILIDSIQNNGSFVQCEINFGPDLKTTSANYLIYFTGMCF